MSSDDLLIDPLHDAGRPLVLIIDDRMLIRSMLEYALRLSLPGCRIAGIRAVAEDDDMPREDVALVVVKAGSDLDGVERSLSELVDTHASPAKALLLLDRPLAAIPERLAGVRVHGMIPISTPVEVAVAAVRLVLAGGDYFPKCTAEARTTLGLRDGEHDGRGAGAAELFDLALAFQPTLTSRERMVMAEMCRGHSNKVIARELKISENTAKMHVRRILSKMKVRNRTEAAVRFQSMQKA